MFVCSYNCNYVPGKHFESEDYRVAAHELGHTLNLDDIYRTTIPKEMMTESKMMGDLGGMADKGYYPWHYDASIGMGQCYDNIINRVLMNGFGQIADAVDIPYGNMLGPTTTNGGSATTLKSIGLPSVVLP